MNEMIVLVGTTVGVVICYLAVRLRRSHREPLAAGLAAGLWTGIALVEFGLFDISNDIEFVLMVGVLSSSLLGVSTWIVSQYLVEAGQ